MTSIDPIVERNEKVVREFIRGWETRDLPLAMAQVTDDMCYLNQPLEEIRGRENVAKMIDSIIKPAKRSSSSCLTSSASATRW
jgi:limonene-1,2-epoxide hydrolase